jgi:N-methylhydantoinase B
MNYGSPQALRMALEQRLLNRSSESGVSLDRLRRRVVFERIVARLQHAEPGTWVLKGGMALEVRLQDAARLTKDIDLGLRGGAITSEHLGERLVNALHADPFATSDDAFATPTPSFVDSSSGRTSASARRLPYSARSDAARSIALAPRVPLRSTTASSSRSVSDAAPHRNKRSLGRSCSGSARIGTVMPSPPPTRAYGEAMRTGRRVCDPLWIMALDPVQLEVVRHALAGVAEEMGVALQRAAYSPNIKERVDCSAAVFAPWGDMVAQAEHIPVHLGSMPASVAAALEAAGGRMDPGVSILLNDPYLGGTHLPDLTLVAGVHDGDGTLLGYVANRAHHADVGGAAPGSMPATATEIAMEGIRIPPTVVADAAGVREDVLRLVAANSRTPAERMGDLRAQFAANHVGGRRLRELAAKRGVDGLHGAMREVCDYSERRVRAAVARIPDGTYRFADVLELQPEVTIRVAVTVEGERVVADFAGTDAQVPVNVNAVEAVTVSCAYFVFRMLTDPGAPPNAGCYRPLEVRTEPGTVVAARFPAPVAAGNVETSQRICDVLLGAFAQALPGQVPAASQGTMNNLLLGASGDEPFSYYETLAGGEGGTPHRAGASGVHTGMTNTRNTPAEAVELAYPLRVWRYELRDGSGGGGLHPGGDGLVREIEVLADATLTLQTERRARGPWGLAGGEPGTAGRNTLVRGDAGGDEEVLPAKGTWPLRAGDRIRVETPGGGGWGSPAPAPNP